jgi:hypothetical protein
MLIYPGDANAHITETTGMDVIRELDLDLDLDFQLRFSMNTILIQEDVRMSLLLAIS